MAAVAYKLLLLAILPCIAALLYFEGQSYDPGSVDFDQPSGTVSVADTTTIPQSPAGDTFSADILHAIKGFVQIGKTREYTRENLYEHINGHAEFFISAGFRKLLVSEYGLPDVPAEVAVQAEIYDMENDSQAFGVLAEEAGENPSPVPLGTLGLESANGVNFVKGRYYVKVFTFNGKASAQSFAQKLEKIISGRSGALSSFAKFPRNGKVGLPRFVKEGYRGLDFLHNVIECEYRSKSRAVKMALFAENETASREVLSAFFDYFEKYGIELGKVHKNGREIFKVLDKYEGDWFLVPVNDLVFGVFGETDDNGLQWSVIHEAP